jgi:hypothetical protein
MALIRLEQILSPLSLSGSSLVVEGDLTVTSGSATFYQQSSSIPAITIYGDAVIHDQPGISLSLIHI